MPAEPNQKQSLNGLAGTVLDGRYRLDRYLSEGGFGVVYQATQRVYGHDLRTVAVKIAKRPMGDQEAREAFAEAFLMTRVAEAATDLALREHFVSVFDAGCAPAGRPLAGHPYIVMQYLRGGTLGDQLRRGAFPLARAITTFNALLEAVSFMHRTAIENRVVIHRDIKPSNVLIERGSGADIVKVSDFGLAVELDERISWAESGGDLAHMAPESFGEGRCTTKSDVYMLGLLFFEMITGRNPFSAVGLHLCGRDAELCDLHAQARARERFHGLEELSELRRKPRLVEIIRAALTQDEARRPYRDAEELRRAWLAEVTGSSDVTIRAVSEIEVLREKIAECSRALANQDKAAALVAIERALPAFRQFETGLAPAVVFEAVRVLWRLDFKSEAGEFARHLLQRRLCKSAYLAMAECYPENVQAYRDSARKASDQA